MAKLLLVYVTCPSAAEAKRIGKHLLKKKLCACVNILPQIQTLYFWPPKSGTIEAAKEAVLLAKTSQSLYAALESEVKRVHSYDVPCVIAIPTARVSKQYADWLLGELRD